MVSCQFLLAPLPQWILWNEFTCELCTTFIVTLATQNREGTGSRWSWGMNTIDNLVHGKQFRVIGVGRVAFHSVFQICLQFVGTKRKAFSVFFSKKLENCFHLLVSFASMSLVFETGGPQVFVEYGWTDISLVDFSISEHTWDTINILKWQA